MVILNIEKVNTIKSNILSHLFEIFPRALFTAEIAKSEARDEEFTKSIMFDLKGKGLVILIKQNKKGIKYLKRMRWRLTNKAYNAYKQHQG